jgi:DNA-binding winged helix-turn-helix (wHTH) protein
MASYLRRNMHLLDLQRGLVRFEGFELDPRAGELRPMDGKNGRKTIRLAAQPFMVLTMLLERPGQVVTREEIRKQLWPNGTVVEFEHSINAAMKRLRQALGDPADNPRLIETLAGRGYRLMVPVEWLEPAPVQCRQLESASVPNRTRIEVRTVPAPTIVRGMRELHG